MDKLGQWFNGGMRVTTGIANDGTFVVKHDQDLQPHVEYATALRNDESYSASGIKRGMWHAAHIPDVVVVELRQIGVDVFDKDTSAKNIVAGLKKLGKEYLLTTTKRV